MLSDLHAHYPMRVLSDGTPWTGLEEMRRARRRPGLVPKLQAVILRIAILLFSNKDWWSGYRITVDALREGGVGIALSVLLRPADEFDPDERFTSPPRDQYFGRLVDDLETVEAEVAGHDASVIRFVHDRAELDRCVADGATALVHCVEGGFHLGDEPDDVAANVAELARRGVAYVTVAHLFYREFATVANALPFMSDGMFRRLHPQPSGDGLAPRAEAAVRAMVRHRVLVDVSHMAASALAETWRLLDEEDPACEMPVVATHAGYRFGKQAYMLDDAAVAQIQRRDGVIGLIMAQHQLNDGVRKGHTESFEDSFEVVCRHVDKIAELTGSHRHVALGTDFDGFVKPTLTGLDGAADLGRLEAALRDRYGDADADLICSGNTLRVLRALWR